MEWKTVTTAQEFLQLTSSWTGPIACDTETAKDAYLLGVSLATHSVSLYIPVTIFKENSFSLVLEPSLNAVLGKFLGAKELIGHNFTYDKRFIDKFFGISSNWIFDTRIGWHLTSAPSGPRPYGLKDAQKEVLSWEKTNEEDLAREVEAKGGRLRKGDHYLASITTLARYACLDAYSTFLLYKKLDRWFHFNEYHWIMRLMMNYNELLEQNTRQGVLVNRPGLQKEVSRLENVMTAAKIRTNRLLKQEIQDLEEAWADRKITNYKREYNKVFYRQHPKQWERFNWNSDSHKRELFFDVIGLEVSERTPGGSASTSADSVTSALRAVSDPRIRKALEGYLKYESANTIVTNFGRTYLDNSISDSRLHPGFNICGTVSYRLSGFKPYLLNAPFNEHRLLRHLICDPGYIGVHADLSAIEPTITAHYSDDPSLAKVFGEGRGDIYLDLALELFPYDKELHEGYDPNVPITKKVKERFSRQRSIAKVIQLAVQYTGTEFTVSKNLTRQGYPTTLEEANTYVKRYWKKFQKVQKMNDRLKELNREQGYLRNVIGRIIQVPNPDYKDLGNRFIQSSAHDVLILWVAKIYGKCKDQGIDIKPILLDCHDSTSNQVPVNQEAGLKVIYEESLNELNDELGLSVRIKAETKTFQTLAGLKGDE